MTSREVKALFIMLIFMTIATTVQSFILFSGQETITNRQNTLEESNEEELNSIYQLLGASAFTARTNMNLAVKTNHYITHPQGRLGRPPNLACQQCWKNFEEFVTKMPTLPNDGNGAYFDAFYRKPYEMIKKQKEEANKSSYRTRLLNEQS